LTSIINFYCERQENSSPVNENHQLSAGGFYLARLAGELEWKFWQFNLIVLLVVYVIPHLVFIDANSGNKVTSTPQTATGKLFRLFLDPR